MAQRKTGQSLNSIQKLKTGGNITTVSSWTEMPTKGLKAVNIDPTNAGIGGDEEDDGWSVQVS
jgi:hypothetical protein